MVLLVLNWGSSSLKYSFFDSNLNCLRSGNVNKLSEIKFDYNVKNIGYRIVFGGKFSKPTKLTDSVVNYLSGFNDIAPLHNPGAVRLVKEMKKRFPKAFHFGVFDTALYSDISDLNKSYPLPKKYGKEIIKHGFHGIAHKYVYDSIISFSKTKKIKIEKILTMHLGSGSSVSVFNKKGVVANSMQFSPNSGPIMRTRFGDFDFGIAFFLHKKFGLSISQLNKILSHDCGMKGIAGTGDVPTLLSRKDSAANFAIDYYVDSVIKYAAYYIAKVGGVDAIAFSGGIGENESKVRAKIIDKLSIFGFELDKKVNKKNEFVVSNSKNSKPIFVINVDEAFEIAKEIKACLKKS